MTGARNEDTSFSVYGIAMITKKIEKCVNTGNLTIKNTAKGDAGFGLEFEACGFAGTVQAFVPVEMLDEFKAGMEAILGEGRCHVLSIRPEGGAVL